LPETNYTRLVLHIGNEVCYKRWPCFVN